MEQSLMKELLFMSKNEVAMPIEQGIRREFAVNQALMLSKKVRYNKEEYKKLAIRQVFLCKMLRERERV